MKTDAEALDTDTRRLCVDCGASFTLTRSERDFFLRRGCTCPDAVRRVVGTGAAICSCRPRTGADVEQRATTKNFCGRAWALWSIRARNVRESDPTIVEGACTSAAIEGRVKQLRAQVEDHVGLRLAFFSFISVSVAAPTLMMATPPIVARRAAEIRGRPIHFSKMSTKPASPDAPLRACAARAEGVLSGLTLS
jgi:hypothetical protein